MCLHLALVLVKAIFQDDKRMEEPNIHARTERALLELREEMCVQNSPVRMQREWIKLIEVSDRVRLLGGSWERLSCSLCESDQFLELLISLFAAFLVRI